MTSLLVGAHVDQEDPLAAARDRSADIVQFFLGDPQGYKGPKFAYAGGADGLKADAEAAGVGLYVHAPYLINVATTNNKIRIPSRKLLQQHVNGAASIGARALIVHGGHVGGDDEIDTGFDNWRKAVDQLDQKLLVLIENTAGGDHAMARHLDRIARLWDAIGGASGGDTIGFCLDTCHFHAGGEELATVVDRVKAITGRIDLVHANDSMDPFDSGRDRHQNLGKGEIDPADLIAVIRAAGAPVIVETPAEDAGQTADVAWLRERL